LRPSAMGRGKVRRKVGRGAGPDFQGSGFYTTDYRSEKYKEAAKKDKPADTTTKPAGSGDSKPAGGGESKRSAPKTESAPAAAPKPGK